MKDKLLSICIPTYNRPSKLKNLLDCIEEDVAENIEIVIRDDSDNNETFNLISDFKRKIKFELNYFKGEKIGLDAASLFLLQKAKGEFIWWIGDDDILIDGAVKEVLKLIKKNHNLLTIWVNYSHKKIDNLAIDIESRYFKDGSEAIEILGTDISFISPCVLKRDIGLASLKIAQKHVFGFSFAFLAVFLYVLTQKGSHYFLRGPFILNYPDSQETIINKVVKNGVINNDAFDIFGVKLFNVINEYSDKLQKSSIRKFHKHNFNRLWRGILVGWIHGWDTPKGKKIRMIKLYWTLPELWVAIGFFLIPKKINYLFYKIYKKIYK